MKMKSIQIPAEEFKQRTSELCGHLLSRSISGAVLFNNYYIQYYTGFAFIPTERPITFLINAQGDSVLFVPRLEVEHAQANAVVDRVEYYLEYPHAPHPMIVLEQVMRDMGVRKMFAADNDGYPWNLGYRGPNLSELLEAKPEPVASFVEDQMAIKSPAELELIMESVKWGNLAHTLLQRYTRVGLTETEVSLKASMEATLRLLDTIGPVYRAQSPFESGASAGYRGQIGRNAAIPHALANNIEFQPGDVLVTGAGAPVWGYQSELERTMIIGPASDQQIQMFDHMLALQNIAFETMKPDVKCAEVDKAVRKYYEEHDLRAYWKHHVGHAIGLRYHEGPFLDIGDPTVLKVGMVFTVEPGLYVPGLGGFRHSDTVVITQDGIEVLTYYPRQLESLTIPL